MKPIGTRLSASLFGRLAVVGGLSLLVAACGKAPNENQPAVLEFPHTLPLAAAELPDAVATPWTSGRALTVSGDSIIAVDRHNGDLVRLDRHSLSVEQTVAVGAAPEQVITGPAGNFFVTVRGTGEVARYSADLVETHRVEVGTDPFGIALSPDGHTVYVTLSTDQEVVALDAGNLEEVDRVETLDLPRGIAVSQEGWLLVVHQNDAAQTIPVDVDGGFVREALSTIALRDGNPVDHVSGRTFRLRQNRALAATIHPVTGAAFIVHQQVAPGEEEDMFNQIFDREAVNKGGDEPVSNGGGYGSSGGSTSNVTFDVPFRPGEVSVTGIHGGGQPMVTVPDFPVQDPLTGEPMTHLVDQASDINHHPTWSLAFVTGYGTDNVLVLNTGVQDPMHSPLAIIDVGFAPRGVAFSDDGAFAYVLNQQSFTVSAIALEPIFAASREPRDAFSASSGAMDPAPGGISSAAGFTRPVRLEAMRTAPFGVDTRSDAVRRGERVFTFARNGNISHAGQFACASCHFEGTEDKLVWIIEEGARQTPSLAGRLADTAPFNWGGTKTELKTNMKETVDRMGGQGLSKQELDDLELFLVQGLVPPRNPNLATAGLTEQQLEGKALFNDETVGCESCHNGTSMTDGINHDVGTASPLEIEIAQIAQDMGIESATRPGFLNTPTLRGLFYTAPYLHDGSAASLIDLLDRTATTMGKTDHLTGDQKQALVSYLLTL
ncbi:MAG: YVTN family beta-propeller protein [Myxococcota bacterium]|jgi:YVTN family beta-propeller protein